MKKSVFSIVYVLAVSCIFIWCSMPAVAQESDTESFMLEEITVTAEKQEANLQKTSISMSVIQGETLLNNGSTTMDDILKDIPNVTTSDSGTSGGLSINIRGLGNDMPVGMGESSVSINFDGAYEARGESTLFGYFDVDRVEVLRGPQGTLYGRNASGGVLNIVSTKPTTDKVEGYASLEIAEYSKKKVEAAVNVPMAENFAGRLAILSVKQEGTTKDDHGYRDPQSGLAARLQFRYLPSEDVSLNLLCNYTEKDGQSWADIDRTNWDAGIYDVNKNTYPYHLTSRNNVKNTKLSLTAEFPVGPGNVTLIPTYETSKGNGTNYSLPMGPPEIIGPDPDPVFNVDKAPYDYKSTTGEVRYSNKDDSDIKWTVGLYYTNTDDPVYPEAARGNSVEFKSTAAFAQVTYPFSDTFRGIAGARFDDTEKSFSDLIGYPPDIPTSGSASYSFFDYKLGVEKDFSAVMMGYFTVASGHKAGGFGDDGTPFDEESNISGELGLKSRFLDNRLQVNGDVFYYIYDGYQVPDGYSIPDPMSPTGVGFVMQFVNANKAKSQGVEIETTTLLGNATVLTVNFAYLKNEYTDDFISHLGEGTSELNLKGHVMPHSPEFTIQAGLDHTFSLPNGDTLRPSVSWRWTDEQYLGFNIKPNCIGPAYSVVDFTLSYNAVKNWSLNFYANNALDEHYFVNFQQDGAVVFPGSPRIMGLTLNYRF